MTTSMPQFVARCLEEIGLEGRCGIPVCELFALTEPAGDLAFRRYAWRVLRGMDSQIHFHIMRPVQDGGETTLSDAELTRKENGVGGRRKRKWATTLLSAGGSVDGLAKPKACDEPADGDHGARKRAKQKHHTLLPVLPSMRRIAAKKQRRRRLSQADSELQGNGSGADVEEQRSISSPSSGSKGRLRRRQCSEESEEDDAVLSEPIVKEDPEAVATAAEALSETLSLQLEEDFVQVKQETTSDAADESQWVFRSPRGFRLGEEVDVVDLSYEDAVAATSEGVLGVVACEELRLSYLGVVDPSALDTISPQFDLLEIIGRARERGENAAMLTNSRLFGDSRKLHYLLDMLVGSNYVVKNIVTADKRRFNIVHLKRFADKFHPSMVSPTAIMERQAFPKELLAQVIVEMIKARGERTCVFADVGRELGYGKRHQELLRNYFFQQMHVKPDFPLELFMARCNTGSEFIGRKLWCLRLRNSAPGGGKRRRGSSGALETFEADGPVMGPVIERGIMEQMFVAIQDRKLMGATVPELRDVLGVPTFKLPYKLSQGLISSYNISVEQVVMGKNTMYRLFAPDAPAEIIKRGLQANGKRVDSSTLGMDKRVTRSATKNHTEEAAREAQMAQAVDERDDGAMVLQPTTMKQATRGVVRGSTLARRRDFIIQRVKKDKIVSIHQLRSGLIEMERAPGQVGATDWSVIDVRSVRRIIDDLVKEEAVISMDVTLPPKQVLQKAHRVVKCVVLPGYQRNRNAIRKFVQVYEVEQQKKYLASLQAHDNEGYVVVSNRRRHLGGNNGSTVVEETPGQEVVKYSAASYKLARVQLGKLHKQSRRLGTFFGILYKCRAFHLLLWDRIQVLRKKDAIEASDVGGPPGPTEQRDNEAGGNVNEEAMRDSSREVTFALKDVLDLLTVKEYIQLVGVSELLTEPEESSARAAVSRGHSWDALPEATLEKIRGCEADRFSKILRVLLDLDLLQVVNDTSQGLLNIFRSSDDFDSMVSKVAFATLSGGLFKLKRNVRITVTRGTKILRKLPSEHSYVYAPGFSCKSRSDHFSGHVPLEFDLSGVEDAKEYWKSLRFLSVEGARLGDELPDDDGVSVNLDAALIRSAPLTDHNIYALKSWVPHATTTAANSSAKAKAAAAAAGPLQQLKHKRFNPDGSAVEQSPQKKRKVAKGRNGPISAFMTPIDTSEAGVSKFRKQVGAKRSLRASKWTLADDLQLMDLYLERMSRCWFVEVPLALQYQEERVAFRATTLSRTLISWKELAKALNKKSTDCLLRVNELLAAPAIQARVEKTKATVTQMKNPGGRFHEELAIMSQPRLAALLCRALQVIFHERASYYSILADMLINNWKESEVKLVWRYLWLAGLITRTSKANEGKDHKQRGFQVHSKVFEMKSLKIPRYAMSTFCEAAEYLSFVKENVEEAAMMADEYECFFEHEVEVNVPAGQAAAELSTTVSGISSLVPTYMAPEKHTTDSSEGKKSMAIKGLAGHLSQQWGGACPEDFLKDYWTVKVVFAVSDATREDKVAQRIKEMEAFSTSAVLHPTLGKRKAKRKSRRSNSSLSSWVSTELTEAAGGGLSFSELCEKFAAADMSKSTCGGPRGENGRDTRLRLELDDMLHEGSVLEVNGYDHIRFVARAFSDLWTLHPYRITSDSTKEKVHFVFDKESTVVARPWLHLDGSANTNMTLMLKRKVVNIVLCCPGIQDHAVHKKMRKILSLQDMRSFLDKLVAEEILYARVVRCAAPPTTSLFGSPSSTTSLDATVLEISPGQLRYVDPSRDRLHYFPSSNCMELLGAEACDADLGPAE